MKRLKLFSFTLLGLLLIASLSFFTSACQQEEAVGAKTSTLDEALLADLAGRYYQPATAEQRQADGELRAKLTREESDRLLDKMLEAEIKQFKEFRAAQAKEGLAKQVVGKEKDGFQVAPPTDQEFAEVLQAAGEANNLKKRANKEAFKKFNRNVFTLSENEKLQLVSFQSLGVKPIADASARTACGAYCTKSSCPTAAGTNVYGTIYAAGATAIISGTTPANFAYSTSNWPSAVDYCGGDCDFMAWVSSDPNINIYVCGATQPGGELLARFGGPGGRIALGFANFKQCGAYSRPNALLLGAGRCKIQYATLDVNLIRQRLAIDIGFFYGPK